MFIVVQLVAQKPKWTGDPAFLCPRDREGFQSKLEFWDAESRTAIFSSDLELLCCTDLC